MGEDECWVLLQPLATQFVLWAWKCFPPLFGVTISLTSVIDQRWLKIFATPFLERCDLYPFTVNLFRLCDCLTNRIWQAQAAETGSFHFLSLGMLALEEALCHAIGLATLKLACLWEAQAPWRGPAASLGFLQDGMSCKEKESPRDTEMPIRQVREPLGSECFCLSCLNWHHRGWRWTIHESPYWTPDQKFRSQVRWVFSASRFNIIYNMEISTWSNSLQDLVHMWFPLGCNCPLGSITSLSLHSSHVPVCKAAVAVTFCWASLMC